MSRAIAGIGSSLSVVLAHRLSFRHVLHGKLSCTPSVRWFSWTHASSSPDSCSPACSAAKPTDAPLAGVQPEQALVHGCNQLPGTPTHVCVTFRGLPIQVRRGARLRTALLRQGLSPHNGDARLINCRGLGTCGTCAVAITRGVVQPGQWTVAEQLRLNFPPHSAPGNTQLRLACQVRCVEDISVTKFNRFWGQGPLPLPPLAAAGWGSCAARQQDTPQPGWPREKPGQEHQGQEHQGQGHQEQGLQGRGQQEQGVEGQEHHGPERGPGGQVRDGDPVQVRVAAEPVSLLGAGPTPLGWLEFVLDPDSSS
ncbi:hypothetical protein V8C86DRAFT_855964 [Haematococcus lacustris]